MSAGGESDARRALSELEMTVRHVSDELASWRRRALKAESQHTELGADHDAVASRSRIRELEKENDELEQRLAAVREQVERLLTRLRFLEEQAGAEEEAR